MKGDDEKSSGENVISSISLFIDKHKRPIQYSFYVLGAVGLATVARSLKAFSQFRKVGDIPKGTYYMYAPQGYIKNNLGSYLGSGIIYPNF